MDLNSDNEFEPPAPLPRTDVPTMLEVIRATLSNPISVWGLPSYQRPWVHAKFLNETLLILNDPDFIRHVLVSNVDNYRMGTVRQLILKPILREGLLTAEGEVWKRSRKAVAPVFSPRHANGFADLMQRQTILFSERFEAAAKSECVVDIATDMTDLTFDILSETLFSGEISSKGESFSEDVEHLLQTMGKVDPLDLIKAPSWVPRLFRLRGRHVLNKFRNVVTDAMTRRRLLIKNAGGDPNKIPQDFLTLLLNQQQDGTLTDQEIEDNLITFIGAGHETTARALGWAIYCIANTPQYSAELEREADMVHQENIAAVDWLEAMPWTRAVFEETMRLYPPAPTISRAFLDQDEWTRPDGQHISISKDTTVLIMPWVLHRHELLWDQPRIFRPERFLPDNRDRIGRFQYLPFGAGPRICIGATFALQEAVIALGVLFHKYKFHCTKDTKPWPVQKLTVQPEGGLLMKITKRK